MFHILFYNPCIRKYWRGLYFRVSMLSRIYAKIKSSRIKSVLQYCKRENFRVGVIFVFFALLFSSRKLPLRENKTHMPLWRKYEYYRENYPHVKCLANILRNFPQAKITTFTVNHRHHTLHVYQLDIDQIYATATFLCDPYLDFPVQGHLIFLVNQCSS